MKLEAFIHATLFDKCGNFKKRFDPVQAKSYVRQMMHLLMIQCQSSALTTKDITDTDRAVGVATATFDCIAAAGTTNRGMVIGTSAQAVSISDNKLIAQVTASITHGSVSFAGPTIDGSTCYFDIIRTFTNATGGVLAIREVGLYVYGGGATYRYMIDRTLYTLDVPIAEAVTLAYRISVTV